MLENSKKFLYFINKSFLNNISSKRLKTLKYKSQLTLLNERTYTTKNISSNRSSYNPWKKVKDPNGSDSFYYWNTETNETTPLDSPKPYHWIDVEDKLSGNLIIDNYDYHRAIFVMIII